MSIASELIKVNNTKKAIKAAIIEKGVSVSDSDTFASYANKVNNIVVGGGDTPEELALLDTLISTRVAEFEGNFTTIRNYAFYHHSKLININLPNATNIGYFAFAYCTSLVSINLPEVTTLPANLFRQCSSLEGLYFPKVTTISNSNFGMFYDCTKLKALVLSANQVCVLQTQQGNHFYNTPIAKGTGYIYVPANLVDSYKETTTWSTYANQIIPIEYYSLSFNNNISDANYTYRTNGLLFKNAGSTLNNIVSNSSHPTTVYYEITKEGYATVSGSIEITENTTIDISMHVPDWQTFIQPILTENGTLGGGSFAVAGAHRSSNQAYYAFDSSKGTYFRPASGSNELIFYNPNLLKVSQLVLTYSKSTYSDYTNTSLYGSNDGENWTNINDFTTASASSQTLTVNSSTGYYYHKLAFTRGTNIRLTNLAITGQEWA